MDKELIGLIVAVTGVVIAFLAWWFPKKSIKKEPFVPVFEQLSEAEPVASITSDNNQIEIALHHLEATIYDDEKTKYIEALGERINSIELKELTSLLEHLLYDDNKVKAVQAVTGKISQNFSADDYKYFLDKFLYSANKQKAAQYVNNR